MGALRMTRIWHFASRLFCRRKASNSASFSWKENKRLRRLGRREAHTNIANTAYVADRARLAEFRVQIEPDGIDFLDRDPVLSLAHVAQRVQPAEQTIDRHVEDEAKDPV